MTTITQLVLSVKQGEVLDIPFNITSTGETVDLTGATILFEVKKSPLASSVPIISKTITEDSDINTVGQINYPATGRWQVHLSAQDTSFAPIDYFLVITYKHNGIEDIISSTGKKNAIYRICTQ